jgi:ApaG protein
VASGEAATVEAGRPQHRLPGPSAVRVPCDNSLVSKTTTAGISVHVTTMFLPDRSSPREGQFLFAYHITIANEGDETAQLVSRHWIITDAEGEVQEVRGEGVIGEQPVLQPGARFEYTSYCKLKTNVGTMHGSYTMIRGDGARFEAQIAPFTLAVPNALN